MKGKVEVHSQSSVHQIPVMMMMKIMIMIEGWELEHGPEIG